MKRGLVILLTFAALAIAGIFIFIPSAIRISSVTMVQANNLASHRVLMDESTWAKWWPHEKPFQLDKTGFQLTKKMLSSFELLIDDGGEPITSLLIIIPINPDSLRLAWSCSLQTGNNPFKRLSGYRRATTIKKHLDFLLDSLSNFLADQKNIYGFRVKKVKVTDSVLLTTSKIYDHYPNEYDTEGLIQKLRVYIKANNAREMNFPMLNIKQTDSLHFEAMAAIATDIRLPDNNEFITKMLFKGGNLLETEITGGQATIRKAFAEYEQVILDYSMTSPAIPYQLLITDRTKEKDTVRWVTKLYYPVF